MYRLTKEEYVEMRRNAITSTYKKTNSNIKKRIGIKGKQMMENVDKEILDRMDINSENTCFIILKDHKENFLNNPTVRLINPAKNELGRISKAILDYINKLLCTRLNINQWKNTASVIEWFKRIEQKHLYKFIMFDIKDFYPSIQEELLNKGLRFAQEYIDVTSKDKEVVYHARKSLLFDGNNTSMKKQSGLFDVTMGAYDGAEVCELVGTYMLSLISEKHHKQDFGFYRDDGLGVLKKKSGPEKIFKENKLDIVIKCNMKLVNYLDVTLKLNNLNYKPYHKPDNEILNIHKDSNHPLSILNQIPKSIEKRIFTLSNETTFNESKEIYQKALEKSGYRQTLKYHPSNENDSNNKRNRKRNVIWFNPPFSANVKTKVGNYFLSLIKKHFPPRHKFSKLFNRNTNKVSYSCMPNIKAEIHKHNKNILEKAQQKIQIPSSATAQITSSVL